MTAMYHPMHYLLLQELTVFFLNVMILEPVHLFENFLYTDACERTYPRHALRRCCD